MNHFRFPSTLFRLAAVCSVFGCILYACHPEQEHPPQPFTISQAQQWFTAQYGAKAARSDTDLPQPQWQNARLTVTQVASSVLVPLHVAAPSTFQAADGRAFEENTQSWLWIGTDAEGQPQAKRILCLPDASTDTETFTGIVVMQDWQGGSLQAYRYTPDGKARLVQITQRFAGQQTRSGARSARLEPDNCTIYDHYRCVKVGNGPWDCYYEYSFVVCDQGGNTGESPIQIIVPGNGSGGGSGDGSAAFPANPQEGDKASRRGTDGILYTFYYRCQGGSCSWKLEEGSLDEVMILEKRREDPNAFNYLPDNPLNRQQVWAPDGLLYTYLMQSRQWRGVAVPPVVFLEPGPVVDPKQETKCFDLTKPATLTIYIEQPVDGTRDKLSGPHSVGHTYIGIEQGGVTRYLGFYPVNMNATVFGQTTQESRIRDNSSSPYNISLSLAIDADKLKKVVNYANNYKKTYDLNVYNCTDFGIGIAKEAGLNLPATTGKYLFLGQEVGSGRNPGDLGEDVRKMSLPAGVTRTLVPTYTKNPNKKGGC